MSILTMAALTSLAFVLVGVQGASGRAEDAFARDAGHVPSRIRNTFNGYLDATKAVHARCRDRQFTRRQFRDLYEYLVSDGLSFKAVQFDPLVTHDMRDAYEEEARSYYAEHHPHVDYRGFVGFEPGIDGLSPRSEAPFYYPIHYMEPIPGNEAAIDLDYYSHVSRRQTVDHILSTGTPGVTGRLLLVKTPNAVNRCTPDDSDAYGVVLMHPGVNLTSQYDVWPREFSSIVVCVPALLYGATADQRESSLVYLHDSTDKVDGDGKVKEPEFLGGMRVQTEHGGDSSDDELRSQTILEEVSMDDLLRTSRANRQLLASEEIEVANRRWTVTVVAIQGEYKPFVVFVILGGAVIVFAGVCIAVWVFTSTKRLKRYNQLKAEAEQEKARLILENARQATRAERELNGELYSVIRYEIFWAIFFRSQYANPSHPLQHATLRSIFLFTDFIAHEVRNPVAVAMAATSFVKTAIHKDPPLADDESKASVRDDMNVIENALKFVSDLLRNMLDMHRAADKQLKVNMSPTDVLHDVLEPVHAMLAQKREDRIKVEVDCPADLWVETDGLRLKQIMLNLGRNSSKFVNVGYIRLCAAEVDGEVILSVEDSGPVRSLFCCFFL